MKPSLKPVHHITLRKDITANELLKEFSKAGVMQAGKLGKAVEIYRKMLADRQCVKFLGLAGAMVPGGMKNIITDMIEKNMVDALVLTGATLTHDLVESLGYQHLKGSEHADDEELNKQGFDRMYNSYMQNQAYPDLEDFVHSAMKKMQGNISITEFLRQFGKHCKPGTILRICADKKIPVFCPGLPDSGLGLQIWGYMQNHGFKIYAFDDLTEILDLAWNAKKLGVIYVGGGLPKNYIQQAMQFGPIKASYGIQITTDRAEHGGSSGAPLVEGVSWGKLEANADFVDVHCDATIALPLLVAALL
ncbi:MAG TPA: deoxyhypusine synthase family protein [Candidatus Nanoarchaeia archaeon]|nr:deoxyhypusine synthase family protein [Candidatus Nanoarchaeia archaeon]